MAGAVMVGAVMAAETAQVAVETAGGDGDGGCDGGGGGGGHGLRRTHLVAVTCFSTCTISQDSPVQPCVHTHSQFSPS